MKEGSDRAHWRLSEMIAGAIGASAAYSEQQYGPARDDLAKRLARRQKRRAYLEDTLVWLLRALVLWASSHFWPTILPGLKKWLGF